MDKSYLGDSVYIEKDDLVPGAITLSVENGVVASCAIFMEFEVIRAFVQYIARIEKGGE